MRRRILVAILSITAVAVVLFGVPLAVVVDRLVEEDATLRIERQAVLAARQVPSDYGTSADPVELPPGQDRVRLALYDRTGLLVAGAGPAHADAAVRRALGNQIVTTETGGAIVVATPITANEVVIGAIRGDQPTAETDARTRRVVALVAGLALLVLAIGAGIAFLVAERLARPVRRLRDAAVQLGEGDFSVSIADSHIPEIDEANAALVLTAQRLDDLVGRERAFSVDASHQLRTPLAGLRAGIETELAFPRVDPILVLTESLDDIGRLERTISELLTLARTPNLAAAMCSLAEVERGVVEDWHGRFAVVGRRLTIADATDVPAIAGSGAVLRHVLDVLLDNALVHGAGETRIVHTVGAESVTLTVTDEGPGITAGRTQDQAPQGAVPHGLGLPLAHRLIASMPGRLTLVHTGRSPRLDIVVGRADAREPS